MKLIRVVVAAFVFSLAASACSSQQQSLSESREVAPSSAQLFLAESPGDAAVSSRQIIKTIRLEMAVNDIQEAAGQIEALTLQKEGYVSAMDSYRQGDRLLYEITVRIPQSRLDEAVEAFRNMATEILHEQLRTEDVTEQLVDLDARLGTLRLTESELQGLLSESRSRNQAVEGIMAIYRELTQIRTEIERFEAQRKAVTDRVEYSAVNISLRPSVSSRPLVSNEWRPLETVRGSVRVLLSALRFLGDAFIALILVILPLAFILGIPVWFLWRLFRRHRTSRRHE